MEQTIGEERVRVSFNVSNNADIDQIKQKAAELINLINKTGKDYRLISLAMTAFEEGAMWAVKSVTANPVQLSGSTGVANMPPNGLASGLGATA